MKCKCGSHAINPHMHERGNDNSDLCDVCYWKEKVFALKESIKGLNGYCFRGTNNDYIDSIEDYFDRVLEKLNVKN